jgi:WD40 repeat protein
LKQAGSDPKTFNLFSNESEEVKNGALSDMFAVITVAFSPDGKMLAVAYGDGSIHVWVLSGGVVQGEVTTAHVLYASNKSGTSGVGSLRFSPDGTILAAMYSSSIKLWDIKQPTPAGKATP